MNRLKLIALSFIIFVFAFFSNTTVAEAATSSNYIYITLTDEQNSDSTLFVNTDRSNLRLKVYRYSTDDYIEFIFERNEKISNVYRRVFRCITENATFDYGSSLNNYDIYIYNATDGVDMYKLNVNTATTSTFSFSDFILIEDEVVPDVPNVSIDMTETNNILNDIKSVSVLHCALFLFYFSYKIIKEIVFYAIERK